MTKTTTAVAVQPKQENSVESFITQAISANVPIETLERLLAMRTQVKAEQAKEAFDSAMAKFQGECPVIEKTKDGGKTKSGYVAYKYAPLDSIVSQTKNSITSNGFSYKTNSETSIDKVKVTIVVKHALGHSEDTSVEVPLGTKTDIMSAPQVVASALTFAKRYAFCNAFGIMTGDEDTDANDVPKNAPQAPVAPPKASNIKSDIMFLLSTLGLKQGEDVKEKIKAFTGIEASEVPADLQEIKNRLEVLVTEMPK